MNILVTEKKKKGRQPKDTSKIEHVMEYFLQIEIKAEVAMIIGPGGIKMKQPSLVAILGVFNTGLGVKVISFEGKKYRSLARPLTESHKKLLTYLGISESVFYWNE